jgi:hypothetical protein
VWISAARIFEQFESSNTSAGLHPKMRVCIAVALFTFALSAAAIADSRFEPLGLRRAAGCSHVVSLSESRCGSRSLSLSSKAHGAASWIGYAVI